MVAVRIVAALGLLALALALAGIYGVAGFAVTQRTREIGIRVALGARTKEVIRHLIGRGTPAVATGVAIGVAFALASSRLLASAGRFSGVVAVDPWALLATAALFALAALLAMYVPARRAGGVDPAASLRSD